MKAARIKLRTSGFSSVDRVKVEIDGVEYAGAARAVTVYGEAGQCPSVELTLHVTKVDLDVEGEVTVDTVTANLLTRLGWSPPS